MSDERNIVLIGMPGAGKSTVGVLLAKEAGLAFLDTDVWIQTREGRTLQEILDAHGLESFCHMERDHVLALDVRGHVLATGGSVVYSPAAMEHLKARGTVVYLKLPLRELEQRVTNMATRGVVVARGQTLRDLFDERTGLYERWADVTVECAGRNQDQLTGEIVRTLALGTGR